MKARGVDNDYIEYMMGHTIDTYHDIQSKGVEFLRTIYGKADLTIRPKTSLSKLDMAKEILRSFGIEPETVLVKDALAEPHRIFTGTEEQDNQNIQLLTRALVNHLRTEVTKAAASHDLGL
jgi:hypothetical protein